MKQAQAHRTGGDSGNNVRASPMLQQLRLVGCQNQVLVQVQGNQAADRILSACTVPLPPTLPALPAPMATRASRTPVGTPIRKRRHESVERACRRPSPITRGDVSGRPGSSLYLHGKILGGLREPRPTQHVAEARGLFRTHRRQPFRIRPSRVVSNPLYVTAMDRKCSKSVLGYGSSSPRPHPAHLMGTGSLAPPLSTRNCAICPQFRSAPNVRRGRRKGPRTSWPAIKQRLTLCRVFPLFCPMPLTSTGAMEINLLKYTRF